jgi:signal transduction histidine kinase
MQVDTRHNPDQQLRDVLHIIATHPETVPCITLILQTAIQFTGATGAAFRSSNSPEITIGNVSTLDLDFESLSQSESMTFNSKEKLLICMIRSEDRLAGVMWISVERGFQFGDPERDFIAALVDGLVIVAGRAESQAEYKKLIRSQNEFVRIVSHDLRSPLTSMRGFADMLGMVGDLNERQEQFVEKVLSGVAQITALVDNIQDAGRFDPETGFYEMTRSQCDLRDMLNTIVSSYLIPAEKQDLKIEVAVSDDVPIINADPNMLVRAITNLVDNAIKYTPNGRKVDVISYVRDGSVVIGVRDSGLGISPEDQKQLFQRGVRVHRQEYKKIKGSGLGLFIVKSVALRHGGDAWVESEMGVGSVFSFNIPLKGANLVIPDETAN